MDCHALNSRSQAASTFLHSFNAVKPEIDAYQKHNLPVKYNIIY